MKGGWIMSEKKLRNITDVLCFLMILGYVMYLVATWGNLPERVPIHFNAHGIPDRYGKKGSLLLEPILGLLILALLMFCQRFPQWWNYPVAVTEENREHIFEIASKMMSVIKLLSIGVCLYAGISGNLGTAPMWPVWILIAGICDHAEEWKGNVRFIVLNMDGTSESGSRISAWRNYNKNRKGISEAYGRYKNR